MDRLLRFIPARYLAAAWLIIICGCASMKAPDGAFVFDKQVDVFGVQVIASQATSPDKVLHAAAVLAEYLDSDEDGTPNNQAVVDMLVRRDAAIVMLYDEFEMDLFDHESLERHVGVWQNLFDEETRPGGAERGVFDASLEEVLHLATQWGYAMTYPDTFGERPGTTVARAMDKARGGHFRDVPRKYPEQAWYSYYDETCDYGCQITEYTYWALTSILGGQDFPGRLDDIGHEWRLNTREKVQNGDPAIYRLLTDPQYKLPAALPDGQYNGRPLKVRRIKIEA